MIQLTTEEEMLLENGFDELGLYAKNRILIMVAEKTGRGDAYNDLTHEDVLKYHKELKIRVFKSQCEEDIEKGFTASNGHFYRTNRDDQINMIGQKDALDSNPNITTILWKTEDVGYIEHTREEWLNVYREAFKHKQDTLFKYNDLKLRVINATTNTEVTAIKWNEEDTEDSVEEPIEDQPIDEEEPIEEVPENPIEEEPIEEDSIEENI